jgi:xanthine dehydrogenase YagT iron-sulfur-binding subunit
MFWRIFCAREGHRTRPCGSGVEVAHSRREPYLPSKNVPESSGEFMPIAAPSAEAQPSPAEIRTATISLTVNGRAYAVEADLRTSLLDLLREHLHLTGSKKGCDHGQCGACTVLVNGRRINSCLTLAVMHRDDEVLTIEGLGTPDHLHPLQAAFLRHDAFQCGYCTPGQICSALGMIEEARQGRHSHVSETLDGAITLSEAEISERMSGNICRCSAYPNIVDAISEVAGEPA